MGIDSTPRILGLLACLSMAAVARAADVQDCHVAVYKLDDGGIVDIASSEEKQLRWRRGDGTTGALHKTDNGDWKSTYGWTDRDDGLVVSFSTCAEGKIRLGSVSGQRIPLDATDTKFRSHDTELAGRLVMPKGNGKVPVAVLVHGAEHDSHLIYDFLQRLLPAYGVGVFVYDKRGTGISGGVYSQDFELLADDAVSAMREARRLAAGRLGRIGYQGGSQAGWIEPLAANRAPVDFVVVSFGLAVSVIDEDQQELQLEMRDEGHSDEEIAKALEVARAAETVIASRFTKGYAELDAVRAKYGKEPWYKDVHGNYTYMLLPYSETELRQMAPKYDWHTPFYYDPMPTLQADKVPQLWIVGGRDYAAPSAETSRRIKSLMAEHKPFTLAYYPDAEHGMTLFEKAANGERVSTRYEPGYFEMMCDFMRDGHLRKVRYGDAVITPGSN